MDDLQATVEALAERVAALEDENARLRASTTEPAPGTGAPARALSRRNLLRLGSVAGAAAAGAVLLRPAAAGASQGVMLYGATNDAGTD